MALSAAQVLETRTTGSDTNGAGFKSGGTGTDWSQQNTAQYAVSDAVGNGTTTVTSASANFGTDAKDNLAYIQGAWYEVTARNSPTSITVDHATGTFTGGTLNIGGALATPAAALALMTVSGMTAYVKSGTYNISTGLSVPSGISYNNKTRLIGYNTSRDDLFLGSGTSLARPIIKAIAAIVGFTNAQSGFSLENFELDGNSATGTQGVVVTGFYDNYVTNCKIHDWSAEGYKETATVAALIGCEVYNCAGTNGSVEVGQAVHFCYIHDCTKPAIYLNANGTAAVTWNCIRDITGAGSDGIKANIYGGVIQHNSIRNVAGSCINLTTYDLFTDVSNNILVNGGQATGNTGSCYGLNVAGGAARQYVNFHHNAFYNNKTAARNVILAGIGDVTLTGDPFTSSSNLTLNNTAGAGAACRNAGYAGTLAQGSVGYEDIGALRHQDPAGGGGGLLTHPGMAGGARG